MTTLIVTQCTDRTEFCELHKESVVLIVDKNRGQVMRFIAEQITLAKSIAERYWRLLEAPDIYWDDDLMLPLSWTEKMPGKKPLQPANIWPLWTLDDSLRWINENGHQFINTYHFRDPEHYETYFTYGPSRKFVRIDASTLSIALLTFIDSALKGEYEGK